MNNMNNNTISPIYSWPVIIALLIFFWPVGLILLFKRNSLDKSATLKSGKVMRGFGITLLVLGTLALIGSMDDGMQGSEVVMLGMFYCGGIALMLSASKAARKAKKIRQYLAVIINGNTRRLDLVAQATGRTYNEVCADVQMLISEGYLKNAFVNQGTGEIILTSAPAAFCGQAAYTAPEAPRSRVVTCHCCGANSTIQGAAGECEYCGAPLK